ncbi:MAG TPA: hypothetical protein VFY32_16255 [Solirubrobacteraceae bacterium]|nr:hypothetical protein [Solirubrobacteraceae bacterium]
MGILAFRKPEREQFLSFFDEGDEPTRVRTRPARPRRPATAARGGGAGAPPDRQTARLRQAVGLGALVVLAFVIVLGFKGCLDSRKDNQLKDYNRNVTAVVNDSDQSVGKPFFQRMANGARDSQGLQVQINQLRVAAEDDVKRAKAFAVPGDMEAAQRNLELVLNLRAEGLTKIADQIPGALGRGQTSEDAINRIAGEMQTFLASDVVHAERVAPLIRDALDKNDVKGQQIAGSRFMTDISWLSPATVAARLGRGGATTTTGTSGTPAPGLHGHGLVGTSIGAVALQPEAPGVVNRVPWSANPAITVKFANQGDNDESNVKVAVSVKATTGKAIPATKTIAQTKAKTESTVNIPLGAAPPAGVPTTLSVLIGKVNGEKKTDNNRSSYTVIFVK